MLFAQARPRRKLKVPRHGKYAGETEAAAAERARTEAIWWYNRRARSGSPAFISVDKDSNGRCYLYMRGPKLCKRGGNPRNLRAIDSAFYGALSHLPGFETYITEDGYHVARFLISPELFASIPLYPEDAQP